MSQPAAERSSAPAASHFSYTPAQARGTKVETPKGEREAMQQSISAAGFLTALGIASAVAAADRALNLVKF
jgi:hypothetical protein